MALGVRRTDHDALALPYDVQALGQHEPNKEHRADACHEDDRQPAIIITSLLHGNARLPLPKWVGFSTFAEQPVSSANYFAVT